jgi:beta-galactosidase
LAPSTTLLPPRPAGVKGKPARGPAGTAGLTVNAVGAGRVIYLGTYLSDKSVSAVIDLALAQSGARPLLAGVPEPVEVARRGGAGKSLLFLLNHSDQPQTVEGVPAGADLITGAAVSGHVSLGPKEVAVVRT